MAKKVTEQDILDVFVGQIEENGETTTNDVKRELRENDFWVFQDTVSSVVRAHYQELGFERAFNGKYYTYYSPDPDENDDLVNVNAQDFVDIATQDINQQKVARGKILGDPEMIDADIYLLKISHNDDVLELVISDASDLEGYGSIAYEIRTNNGKWYLYTSTPNILTRHKAIYYAWFVLTKEYDESIEYKDLRTTKLN